MSNATTATTPTTAAKATRGSHLAWVPLADLGVNPRAQREFLKPWAETILAEFDIDKLQFPTVNERDGRFFICDGQHSVWAYKMWLGSWSDQKIQCLVHRGLTEEQEAELFLSLNNKKAIRVFDRFRVAVSAGRYEESDIDRIVRANGCKISKNKKQPGAIGAVSALSTVYRDQGAEVLGAVIRTIRDAFGDSAYESPIIRGLGLVLGRYPALDRARFVVALHGAQAGAKGLLNAAYVLRMQVGGAHHESVAAAAVNVYNRSKGPKLPNWFQSSAAA